jgi:type II secretory pathway pseudopilin PulG
VNKVKSLIVGHPFVATLTALIVGLVVAGAIGASAVSSKQDDLDQAQADLERTTQDLQDAQKQRDAAQQQADAITSRANQSVAKARRKADDLVTAAAAKKQNLSDQLSDLERKVSDTQAKLTNIQGQLSTAQETQAKSSFGNGIWQANVDFIPGTYRAPGGGGCYWAKLNSGNTNDIADNNFAPGQQVTSIDSPFFESEDCGTWQRVGD